MDDFPDEQTKRLRCALFAYLDSDCAEGFTDEDEARARVAEDLRGTMEQFLEGGINLGTVKYRLDTASVENGHLFPSTLATAALSDLALGVPIDDLEPEMRRAARPPEDLGAAKGALLDLLDFLDRQVTRGNLRGSQVSGGRWAELLATMWHIQDASWPLLDRTAFRYLEEREDISPMEPAEGYAEYAAAVRGMAEQAGTDPVTMEHVLSCLARDAFDVPPPEEMFQASIASARRAEEDGRCEEAIERYERALALRPDTPDALRRKAELYEKRGLPMAAIAELEALIELEPKDLTDHRRLLGLYKSRKMIREYNIEVRRFKALMLGPSGP